MKNDCAENEKTRWIWEQNIMQEFKVRFEKAKEEGGDQESVVIKKQLHCLTEVTSGKLYT